MNNKANVQMWQDSMLKFGKKHAAYLIAHQDDVDLNQALGATYYDSERVFYQIADYTQDKTWLDAADAAHKVYAKRYLLANQGAASGYWKFPHGLSIRHKRSPSTENRTIMNLLATKGAYNTDATPFTWIINVSRSREVAYGIHCLAQQEKVFGVAHRKHLDELYSAALGHAQQWAWTRTAPYCQPFMVGLTADALIAYDTAGYETVGQILPIIRSLANFLWDNLWIPEALAFKYVDKVYAGVGGPTPAPDLNQLIAPMFGWLYFKTKEAIFRDRGDLIFNGGVQKAWLDAGKQFNQNYRSSFDYLRWTDQLPQSLLL